MNKSLQRCTQCGECCRKGGPLLHIEDMPLVYEGHICLSKLVTLRKGELAHDDVTGCLTPLTQDVIKIAGTKEQDYAWHCVLHGANGCTLHPLRPAQCAALYCGDTSALEGMYKHDLATREHIFAKAGHAKVQYGWFELANAHAEECSFDVLAKLAADYKHNQEDILQMLRYDLAFRELCVQKAHVPADVLDCLLGRNLGQFLYSFGLEVRGKSLAQVGKNFHEV